MKKSGSRSATLLAAAALCFSGVAAWPSLKSYLPSMNAASDPLVVKARQRRQPLQVRNSDGRMIGTLIADGDKWRFVTVTAEEIIVEDSEITLAGNVAAIPASVVEKVKSVK